MKQEHETCGEQIAAGYIRVSTHEQTNFSPESQEKALRQYAVQHGMRLPEELVFYDLGISGRHTENRPGFQQMIREARRRPRPFEVILVWKYSRFARNRRDSIFYKQQLKKRGIRVVSVTEPLQDDSTSVLMEAMLEAMDEYYSLNLGQEVRRGMRERFLRGENVTAPPFGYAVREGRLEVVSKEAEALRCMKCWREAGASYREIAERLNAQGVRTKRGGLFHGREVSYMLSNPVYYGRQRWQGQEVAGKHECIFLPESKDVK